MDRRIPLPNACIIEQLTLGNCRSTRSIVRVCNTVVRAHTRLIIGIVALATSPAHALTLCANSQQSIQTALALAQTANEGVTIRIAGGGYTIAGLDVVFSAPTTLIGGYDANCQSRSANVSAADTVLDFAGNDVSIWQKGGTPVSLFQTDGLSLMNARDLMIHAGDSGEEGNIHLSRTRVTGVPSGTAAIEFAVYGRGSVRLDNVLVDTLPAAMASGQCSVAATLLQGGTILLDNTTIALPANRTLCLSESPGSGGSAGLYNSIVWSAT